MGRALQRSITIVAGIALATSLAPIASAGQPIDRATLTPVPADFYTCKATGGGAICTTVVSREYGPDETGIFCGSGASAFQVLDRGTQIIRATRWYDTNGLLTTLKRQIDFDDPHFYNPLTGKAIYYHQRNMDNGVLAVPGDLSTISDDAHGQFSINVPGYGTVVKEAGHLIWSADGELLKQAGQSDYQEYLAGDTALMDDLCQVLGG
jgi:hypothetical protein